MLRISVAPASASSLAGGPGSQMSSPTVRPPPPAPGAFAGVMGGGGDVEDRRGARQCLLAGRWPRLPDVLAHGQPDAMGAHVDDRAGGSSLKVALLVEDAVAGQVDLPIDRVHAAPGEDGRSEE